MNKVKKYKTYTTVLTLTKLAIIGVLALAVKLPTNGSDVELRRYLEHLVGGFIYEP